jgi:hypothetical protein
MKETAISPAREQIFQDHCVVFVDFLGFSNIVASGDDKMADLLKILRALQSSQSDFAISHRPIDERLGSIEVKAALSAFSDHVVISYPLERMYVDKGLNEQTIPYIVMDHARSLIADIASRAFTLGMLVRGGITVGKLYHEEGVVFGQGLIDAYQLESEVAVYPRVVLSTKMSSSAAWRTEDRRMVKRDFDGVCYLDYLHPMIMSFSPGGINWIAELAKRMDIVNAEVQENIQALESKGRLKEAAKWGWLYNKLADSMKTLPQDGLSDHGVTREQLARLGLRD